MGAMMRTDEGRSVSLDARFEATSSKADALMARLTAARDPTRPAAAATTTTTFALPDPTLRSSLRAPYRPLASRQPPTASEAAAPAAAAPAAIQPSSFTARKLPSARAAASTAAATTIRPRERQPQPNPSQDSSSAPVRRLTSPAAAGRPPRAPSSEGQHGGALVTV